MSGTYRMTRRSFLGSAGAAVLGAPLIVPARALGAENMRPANDRIQVACIGIRNRGRDHVNMMLNNKGAQIVAICDVDSALLADRIKMAEERYAKQSGSASFKGIKGYRDFRELLAQEPVDAVLIGTPDHTHAVITIAAANAKKDIYVEKPMTHNIAEGQAIIDAVRRNKIILQVGSQRRSDAKIREQCELVRNGRIGKLHTVRVTIGVRPTKPQPWQEEPVPPELDYGLWIGPAPMKPYTTNRCHYNFRFIRDYSGGEITNTGAHYLDLAQWAMGTDDTGPIEIAGRGEKFTTGLYDVYHHLDVEYTYANGVKLICSAEGKEPWSFEGTIPWDKADRSPIGADGVRLYDTGGKNHPDNWIECIRSRKDPSAPVEVGHRTAAVCHLGNLAIDLGRKLKWDPVKEEFPGDDEANKLRARDYRKPWTL